MLRITIEDGDGEQTIRLEGKIVGLWAEEFGRVWESLASAVGTRRLQVDLRSVAFIDGRGRQLLRDIYRQTSATFLTNSPLMRHFAEEAMQEPAKNGKGA